MITYSQSTWFATRLQEHWSQIQIGLTANILEQLSSEEYMKLKQLYYKAFAENQRDAKVELDLQLGKMGILSL